MNENAAVCLSYGAAKGTGKSFCSVCGAPVNENAVRVYVYKVITDKRAKGQKL